MFPHVFQLMRGSVDFHVGEDYSNRPLQKPIYVFAIDVSKQAQQSGLSSAALRAVRTCLSALPGIKPLVGIFTFDTKLQFYEVRPSSSDPVRLLIVDSDEPVAALPAKSWILPLESQMDNLDLLFDKISELYNLTDTSTGDF